MKRILSTLTTIAGLMAATGVAHAEVNLHSLGGSFAITNIAPVVCDTPEADAATIRRSIEYAAKLNGFDMDTVEAASRTFFTTEQHVLMAQQPEVAKRLATTTGLCRVVDDLFAASKKLDGLVNAGGQ